MKLLWGFEYRDADHQWGHGIATDEAEARRWCEERAYRYGFGTYRATHWGGSLATSEDELVLTEAIEEERDGDL